MPPSRFSKLTEARAAFGDRVDRLAPWFDRVDPLADDVVEAIESLGQRRGWQMLELALDRGIDSVPDAPEPFRALFEQVDRVPTWVDWPTVDLGGELLLRAGLLGGLVLGLKSLPLGYASPGGNKPLVFSGRLREQAGRRLNETARFVQAVVQPGGMRRWGDGFRITVKVRLMHAQVRRMILKSNRWRPELWGAPINQHDMAGTTLLFSAAVIDGLRTLGLRIDGAEAEAYMHLWRYVGWVIGVDPDVLPASEQDGFRLADLIATTMGTPDDDSRALVRALLESPGEAAPRVPRGIIETQIDFAHGFCRGLVGDDLADELRVRRNAWRMAVPVFRRIAMRTEFLRENVPGVRAAFVSAGRKYWQRVVEVGLAGASAEFALPERLSRAA
jgi:hypothetical protein